MKFFRFLGFLPFVSPAPSATPVIEKGDPIKGFLNMTADVIEANGWAQGVERSDDGRYCVYGAMVAVKDVLRSRGISNQRVHLFHLQSMQRMQKVVTRGTNPMTWNDHVATSSSQVIAGLRKAADYKPWWRL